MGEGTPFLPPFPFEGTGRAERRKMQKPKSPELTELVVNFIHITFKPNH
jgi:hypothetical protein